MIEWLRSTLWKYAKIGSPCGLSMLCLVTFKAEREDGTKGFYVIVEVADTDLEKASEKVVAFAESQADAPCHVTIDEINPLWHSIDPIAESGGRVYFSDDT